MPFQPKSNIPRKLKYNVTVYKILSEATGRDYGLSDRQVISRMAIDSRFYDRVEELRRAAKKTLSKKDWELISKQLKIARIKYMGDKR